MRIVRQCDVCREDVRWSLAHGWSHVVEALDVDHAGVWVAPRAAACCGQVPHAPLARRPEGPRESTR